MLWIHYAYTLYLQLLMQYSKQIWIENTPLRKQSIDHSSSGAGDVITMWLDNIEKSLYIQLWIDYGHPI